jgi:hypothetical protein
LIGGCALRCQHDSTAPTYLRLILQLEVGTQVEAAFAFHRAHNRLGSVGREVDSCHHFMHIRPVHHTLVWNVPHPDLCAYNNNNDNDDDDDNTNIQAFQLIVLVRYLLGEPKP